MLRIDLSLRLYKLSALIICALPILGYYVIGETYLNSFLMIGLFSILLILSISSPYISSIKLYLFSFLVYFIAYSLLVKLLGKYELNLGNLFLSSIVSILVVFLINSKKSASILIKYYITTSTTILVFYIFQLITFYILGMKISGQIPFLTLHDGYILSNHIFGISQSTMYTSFSSVFSERAHMIEYCCPFLFIQLFGINGIINKNIKISIAVSILFLLSFSGTAMIILIFAWFVYYLKNDRISRITKIISLVVFVILAIFLYFCMNRIPSFNSVFTSMFVSSSGTSKASYRIYRGFDLFLKLPFDKKLLGVGFKGLTSFAHAYDISSKYDVINVNYEYLNAFSQNLIYFGFIGSILLFSFYYQIFKKGNILSKIILSTLVFLSISSSIFLESNWILYVCLSMCIGEIKK